MSNLIDGVNFFELETEKYWSFPKSYKKDPKVEAKQMIFSGDYIGSRKIDGAYYRFVKDMEGNVSLQGRSRSVKGVFLNKIGHVPHLNFFFNYLPKGTCLLGEIYFPEKEGSHNVTTIMGCLEDKAIRRQEEGDKLHYYIFDVWAYDGKSLMNTPVEERIKYLDKIKEHFYNFNDFATTDGMKLFPHGQEATVSRLLPEVHFAKYYEGKNLWENLQKILEVGGEGVVIIKKGTHPEPGKRPARKTLKIKKEISQTIDCFFTGKTAAPTRLYSGKEIRTWKYWENVRTLEKLEGEHWEDYYGGAPIEPVTKPYFYGWAGSLEIGVLRKGKIFPIGWLSGVSDEIKANIDKYKDLPIEVTAMEFTEDRALRHGRLVGFRPDLKLIDCNYEKIWGNEQ